MPQPISYNSGTPVSGSIQDSNLSYVVDGQGRDYRGGYGGLSWMSSIPTNDNSLFIKNTTDLGRGPAGAPLFWTSATNSELDILDIANLIPGSPRNFTDTGSAYSWALQNGYFIISEPYNQINADGLSLYVDADKVGSFPRTDTTWYDLSGAGVNASLVNGPAWNSNGWIDFDGVDDWGRLTGFALSTTAYTKIAWFNPDGVTNNIISGGSDGQHAFWMAGTATTLQAGHNGAWGTVAYSPGTMTGRWWFGAVTFNTSTGWVLYLNGSAVSTSTSTGTFSGGTAVRIAAYNDASNLFNGQISTAQIYNRVLSIDEIKQNYFGGPIVTDGLVYALDAGNLVSYPRTGTATYSLTGSGTGTLVNGVGYNSLNGGSWVFDGVDDYINTNSTFSSYINASLPITFEVWVYVNLSNNDEMFLGSSWSNGGVNFRKTGTSYTANKVRFLLFTNGSNGGGLDSPVLPSSGWYHCVGTYNGGGLASSSNFKLYINGGEQGTSAQFGSPTTIPVSNNILLGQNGQVGSNAYLNGKIATARIYNRVLTPSEVLQNYNAQQ